MEALKEGRSLPMQQVLMFDGRKRLCAMFASQYAAAAALKVSKQAMNQAVKGSVITTGGFYFRTYNPNIIVDYTMLGTLRLDDFDEACGVERKTFDESRYAVKVGHKYETDARHKAMKEARAQRRKKKKEKLLKLLNEKLNNGELLA